MAHRKQFLVSFLTLLFISAQVTAQSDYYPLLKGARYLYEVKASQKTPSTPAREQTFSAMVIHLPEAVVQGKTVTPEGRYIDGKLAGVIFVADEKSGIYYYANQKGSQKKPVLMNPIQYLIKYPIQIGATWNQESSAFETLYDKRLSVTLHASIEAVEEMVVVPAGVYAGCLKIRMAGKIPASAGRPEFRIDSQLWYAPGMGMIKQIQTEERFSDQPASFTMVLNLQEVQYGDGPATSTPLSR